MSYRASLPDAAQWSTQVADKDWRDEKRAEVFEGTLRGLENHHRNDPSFDIAEVQGALNHLYVAEGNDWLGRGELGDIVMSATIAAYEHFIHEWKAGRYHAG